MSAVRYCSAGLFHPFEGLLPDGRRVRVKSVGVSYFATETGLQTLNIRQVWLPGAEKLSNLQRLSLDVFAARSDIRVCLFGGQDRARHSQPLCLDFSACKEIGE